MSTCYETSQCSALNGFYEPLPENNIIPDERINSYEVVGPFEVDSYTELLKQDVRNIPEQYLERIEKLMDHYFTEPKSYRVCYGNGITSVTYMYTENITEALLFEQVGDITSRHGYSRDVNGDLNITMFK